MNGPLPAASLAKEPGLMQEYGCIRPRGEFETYREAGTVDDRFSSPWRPQLKSFVLPSYRHRICVLMLVLVVVFGLASSPFDLLAQTPVASPDTASAYDPDDLLAIKPALRESVAASLPQGMTRYDIDVSIPDGGENLELHGEQTVIYTNTTGEPLDALPFRLYANSVAENNDAVRIDAVTVDGEDATVELTVDNSVATIPLPATLAPGEQTRMEMDFTTRPDQDDPRHYGIFNHASETDTWSLAHWYPVVAGRDPISGWMLDPTSIYGDPIFTDTGLYTVSITAPEGMQLITSGVETASELANGMSTTTFNAWPSRDFVIIADRDMEVISQDIDGTTVNSWTEPGHQASGEAVLLWSGQALGQFNELLGEYPYLQLQVVEVEIYNAAGVEFPQLLSIDRGYYGGQIDTSRASHFEFTVAHEVVHQWFYNLVGNNQYEHAFIDESLTNYLSAQTYFAEFLGEDQAKDMVQRNLTRPFMNAVESNTDPIVDFPTDAFPTQQSYIVAAYSKGPLGFAAIHDAMGEDAFFAALRQYVADFSYRVATPADLLAAFEDASDIAITPIWSHWFEQRNGALDINP